jgi:capsid protein
MGWFSFRKKPQAQAPTPSAVHINDLPPARFRAYGGENQPGALGAVNITQLDYWTLRARSADFFTTRLFARGIVRRLVTGVITAGLYLESTPVESILGRQDDELAPWAEDVEQRFAIWAKLPIACDAAEQATFGALQETAFREALISGDALVTLTMSGGKPRVKLYRGDVVQSPILAPKLPLGTQIKHGVEVDADGKHLAYWIVQTNGEYRRLPCWGASGRRLAWLVYASDRRLDAVRGEPLLSLAMQGIAHLEQYRDATITKADLNSRIALWIEKTEDKPGSRALTGGAVRVATASTTTANGDATREFRVNHYLPGMVVEELQTGEKIHQVAGNGTDEKYGDFEEAITQGVAWAFEIPPEVLRLSFSSNYSASKAAENNFAVYLFKTRTFFGEQFCQPIYVDWLISSVLAGDIQATGLLESWRARDLSMFGAWTLADWSGNVKPSVDPVKQVAAYKEGILLGLIDPATACREFSGQKLSRNLRALAKYMTALKAAGVPEMQPKPTPQPIGAEDDEDAKNREDAA